MWRTLGRALCLTIALAVGIECAVQIVLPVWWYVITITGLVVALASKEW